MKLQKLKLKISLTMIVRNEEVNIGACLQSVKGLMDEIIVVDTGSTDRTKEIAAQYGAVVYDFPWIDDFSAARNKSLEMATGDWIFWLDADHRVDIDNYLRLKKLFKKLKQEKIVYEMMELSPRTPSEPPDFLYYPRLFLNDPNLRWRYRIHEQILPSFNELEYQRQRVNITIHHVGYTDSILKAHKLERNIRILEMEQQENLGNIPALKHILFHLSRSYRGAGRLEEALSCIHQVLEITTSEDPYFLLLYPELISIYTHLERWEEALQTCEKGMALSPQDGNLLFRESLIWDKLGNLPKAQACLLKLLQPDVHYFVSDLGLYAGKIRHNLGVFYFRQGNTVEAEKQWLMVLKKESAV